MSTSRKIAVAAITLVVALCGNVGAQNASGIQGSELGQQLLNNAQKPTHEDKGGKGGAGSFNLGGVNVDTTEFAPGVTKEAMRNVAKPGTSMSELEDQGTEQFNSTAQSEGAAGEAARAMMESRSMSTEEVLQGDGSQFSLVENHYLKNDPLGETFADCKATKTTSKGSIVTTVTKEHTCTTGTANTICGRLRTASVEFGEQPSDPALPKPVKRITDQIAFNGQCETEAADNQCRVRWTCTDSKPRTVDGVLIDEAKAIENGFAPLYPGAPALCWAAAAKVECPVCIEDENGNNRSCSYVDISQEEGASCTALQSDGDCRATSSQCILTDENGNCSVTSRRFTCSKQVAVESTQVQQSSPCAIQCTDGSCSNGIPNDEKGMSIQVAMAQMAVADAVNSDMTRDSQTIKESKGPAEMAPPDTSNGGEQNAAREWGYDSTDRGGEDAAPEHELTEAQRMAVAEAQLFKGNPYTCQTGYGGLVNCCKATESNAKELFWKIHSEVTRNNQAARLAKKGGQSGYEVMQQGGAGLSTLSNPFTSMRDNVMGGGSGGFTETTQTVYQQFLTRAREEIKPALKPKWACSETEFDLAVQREIGACSYAGTYCSKKVLGSCLKRREAYCCYKSPMSKMLRSSAEPGGVLKHGNPKQPDCSGLPLDEIDRINWDQMDFSQLAVNMDAGGAFEKTNDTENVSQNLTGSGAAAASQGRKNVEDRTSERLAAIDSDAVYENIAADAASRAQAGTATVQATPARLSFSNGYRMIRSGTGAGISVTRVGSLGGAAVRVAVVQGSPDLVGFYSGELSWANGEVGAKSVRLNPPVGATGTVILELTALQGSVAGTTQMTVEIR